MSVTPECGLCGHIAVSTSDEGTSYCLVCELRDQLRRGGVTPRDSDPRPVWADDAAVERAADAISDVGRRYANALPEDEGEYCREAAAAALRAALEGPT